MLVTFSGLDGAGKSTLIGDVVRMLRGAGRPCAVFHMNDDIGCYAYLRRLRDLALRAVAGGLHRAGRGGGEGAASARAAREDVGLARARLRRALRRVRDGILWSRAPRRLIYPLDVLIFLVYRLYHEFLRGRVLIMDRYFYDTLVDVYDARSSGWLRLLERITPAPDVAVFLDITPEESFARKGEYSVEYLRRRGHAYAAVFSWLPRHIHLHQPGRAEARRAVCEAVRRAGSISRTGRSAWESC